MSRYVSPTSDNSHSSQLELAFEDNRLAAQLYGDFDQHLALIEQRLGVQATPRGNHVMLRGAASAVSAAAQSAESPKQASMATAVSQKEGSDRVMS